MSDDPVSEGAPVTLEELTAVLRRHEGPPKARSRPAAAVTGSPPEPPPRRRRWWRPRLAWTLAAVAAALLVGSGLGFGVGSSVTPSGSAGPPYEGFGFLPLRGWTVVQSGALDTSGAATAIAANVPLNPKDDFRGVPHETLELLPAQGVLLRARFSTRGDPAADIRFEEATPHLSVSAAQALAAQADPLAFVRGQAHHRLRAAVGGYNVEVDIYFGASPASAELLAVAQRQLTQLVVASERVTINVRPRTVVGNRPVTLYGTVDSDREGEEVTIQAKDCGRAQFFTGVESVQTHAGGSWSLEFNQGVSSTVRAVWRGEASAPVTVQARAWLQLRRLPASRTFEATVIAARQFWHKRVELQRLDRRLGKWTRVRSLLLTEQGAFPGYRVIRTWTRFTPPVPKGTLIRVVLPLSQARPCFLAGTSNTWRT
jgi:hypothetical protein